jgi:hypothetical protein
LFGCFHRYFVRYLASNGDSLSSSSLPSYGPLSRPSSFPEYSTGNLETNVWSFLERNQQGSGVRRDRCQAALGSAGPGPGMAGNEERESRRTPAGWLDSKPGLDYALVEHRVGELDKAGDVRGLDRFQLQDAEVLG